MVAAAEKHSPCPEQKPGRLKSPQMRGRHHGRRETSGDRESAARQRMLQMIRGLYGNPVADTGENDVVLVRGITFTTCGHHLLPCLGKVHVAYLAGDRTVSAARLTRTVNALAPGLHGQRLADDVADAVALHLSADAVAVVVEMDHVCIEWSDAGPDDGRAVAVRGRFQAEPALGAEVITLLSTEPVGACAGGIVPEVLFEGVSQ